MSLTYTSICYSVGHSLTPPPSSPPPLTALLSSALISFSLIISHPDLEHLIDIKSTLAQRDIVRSELDELRYRQDAAQVEIDRIKSASHAASAPGAGAGVRLSSPSAQLKRTREEQQQGDEEEEEEEEEETYTQDSSNSNKRLCL